MSKILLCDDEINIVEVLESYLVNSGFEVIMAKNGVEALDQFNKIEPDLIVLDIMMPGLNGKEVCREIRRTSEVPIIMLTAKIEEEDILEGFDLGVDDYVTKPFSPRQVVARVNAVLKRRGISKIDEIKSEDENIILYPQKKVLKIRGEIAALTATEYKLMESFMMNQEKVFSRNELMNIALGMENESYDRVIDTHIKNLRKKIEVDNRKPLYIKTVHGLGYKFGGRL